MNPDPNTGISAHQPPLFGRDREQQVLRGTLDSALRGNGCAALIGGEAGIGKSALANGICHAARTAIVLCGHCYELSETPPYGPWVELFSRYQPPAGGPDVPEVFAQPGSVGSVTSHTALAREICEFFERLTRPEATVEQPAVLLLEDMHWADPASLEVLRLFVRTVSDLPILILATYRSDELSLDHPLARLLPALMREGPCLHFELPRLEESDLEMLVTHYYSLESAEHQRLANHLFERAGGNPFFTLEILRTLEEGRVISNDGQRWTVRNLERAPVPTLVRHVIESRLARLDQTVRENLAIAAVIGQEVPLKLWAAVATSADDLQEVIDRAIVAHILEDSPDRSGLRFVHALIRETLYAATPLPLRQRLHLKVAEALIADPDPDPDAVASHLRRAGDERASVWLISAGDRAQQAFAWATAIERYQVALDVLESRSGEVALRVWLHCVLGLLHRYTDPERGVAYIEDGARLATLTNDPLLHAITLYFQGHVRGFTGEGVRTFDQVSRGLAALDALQPADRERFDVMITSGGLAREYNPWASASVTMTLFGRYREASKIIQRLQAEEPNLDARARVRNATAYRALTEIHSAYGQPDASRRAAARAQANFSELDHQAMLGNILMIELFQVVLPYQTDDLAARQALADAVVDAWRVASGSVIDPEFSPRSAILPLLILSGQWDEAERIGSTLLRLGWFLDTFAAQIASLARWRGNDSLAWDIINGTMLEGSQTAAGTVQFPCALQLQRIAAQLTMDAGNLPAAEQWLDAHSRWLAWNGAVLGRAQGEFGWAAWHHASGNVDQALARAHASLDNASDPRQPVALIAAHRLLGELHTDITDVDEATRHLRAALSLAEACSAPFEVAQTLFALGKLNYTQNSRHEGLAQIRAALTIFERLGAKPLMAQIQNLQLVDPPDAGEKRNALTPRESEVLQLIAQGLDNAAIANKLSVSPHTVHRHVANILTKLEVPTRGAAVASALRSGLL